MSKLLTPVDIASCWARSFADSRILGDFAQRRYGKAFTVEIGVDLRRRPTDENAPFLVIFPDSMRGLSEKSSSACGLGVIAGIVEEEKDEKNGYSILRGLSGMNELCPLLEEAMRFALPRARIAEISVDYELILYPLFQAVFEITVEQGRPIGGP